MGFVMAQKLGALARTPPRKFSARGEMFSLPCEESICYLAYGCRRLKDILVSRPKGAMNVTSVRFQITCPELQTAVSSELAEGSGHKGSLTCETRAISSGP